MILYGRSETGTTALACSVAGAAAYKGSTSRFDEYEELLEEICLQRAVGGTKNFRAYLAQFDLLIIDDFGCSPITSTAREDIRRLVTDTDGVGAILFTSLMLLETWHQYFDEPSVADSIVDRMRASASPITFKGDTRR